ncbi:hypothetical protein [Pelagovum pacificum]|uniref:Uncharacterized protein n=1 Tax=Pelagovum pacificum TaxID=2588711 RepID=A0A5C5GGZ5_9RHOB|nr:hypothetical protein [Pelagovum pacificum]QQA42813.1 hypothetical protein I8N54_18915 [Pelagovum pacificum]TNY34038.1 hypothetical protein FHY64_12470 [Pelagovum pacificum]
MKWLAPLTLLAACATEAVVPVDVPDVVRANLPEGVPISDTLQLNDGCWAYYYQIDVILSIEGPSGQRICT